MPSGRLQAIALLLVAALSLPPLSAAEEPELLQGIHLVSAGDFENAVPPLAAVIVKLSPDLRRREELARAYLYLGVAYLELGQEIEARGKFRETLRNMPKTKLADTEFSAQVRRVFQDEALAANPPKKKRFLPVGWVIGAGSAAAGAAVGAAAAGGEAAVATTTTSPVGNTTTTTLSGGGPGSTTTTTRPSGPTTTTTTTTTTLPGTPTTTTTTTTTLPGATTTTTSSTTTTTTTTTQPPGCTYSAGPDRVGNNAFLALGGNGTCNITVSPQSCHWSVSVNGDNPWLHPNNPIQGNGNGSVSYSVAILNLLQPRTADIRVDQNPSVACTITQKGILGVEVASSLTFDSRLEAAGARGQIVLNGQTALYQEQAFLNHTGRSRDGANRIEAIVVAADGKPGTWRFELSSGFEPGSLVVLAGEATVSGAGTVVFHLTGKAGQRFVFGFQGRSRETDRNQQ